MTDNQLKEKREQLLAEMKAKGFGWIEGKYIKPPKEYELKSKEFSCIDMINSILAYDWFGQTAEGIMEMEERSRHNYLFPYTELLGRDKVISLIQEQMNSIQGIDRDAYTDGEGVVYNSIIWKQE